MKQKHLAKHFFKGSFQYALTGCYQLHFHKDADDVEKGRLLTCLSSFAFLGDKPPPKSTPKLLSNVEKINLVRLTRGAF